MPPDGEVTDAACAGDVLRAGGLCCDARLVPPDPARRQGWRVLGDTTEGAILVAAAKGGVDLAAEQDRAPPASISLAVKEESCTS
jgi:P-type Ca2+ transporter type 2C